MYEYIYITRTVGADKAAQLLNGGQPPHIELPNYASAESGPGQDFLIKEVEKMERQGVIIKLPPHLKPWVTSPISVVEKITPEGNVGSVVEG